MSKFNVGDKVRVVENPKFIGDILWMSDMNKCCGREFTIRKVHLDEGIYGLLETDFLFHEDWLEPVERKDGVEYITLNVDIPVSEDTELSLIETLQNTIQWYAKNTDLKHHEKRRAIRYLYDRHNGETK